MFSDKARTHPSTGMYLSRIDDERIYIYRKVCHSKPRIDIDVIGRGWIYLRQCNAANPVAIRKNGKITCVSRGTAVFLPPFSIIEWLVPAGQVEFEMIVGMTPPPTTIAKNPVLIAPDDRRLPVDVGQIFDSAVCRRKSELVDHLDDAVPNRVKTVLTEEYENGVLIGDAARHLRAPLSSVSRSFKRQYGLSPVVYLNRLRVIDSVRHLIAGTPVSDAAYQVGFGDLSHFHAMFKKQMSVCPAVFKDQVVALARTER